MTPRLEPDDDILMRFAFGTLDPGLRLLVCQHLERSERTRARLRSFEHLGGDILVHAEASALTAGSLDRALARISRVAPASAPGAAPQPTMPDMNSLAWRWAGPGSRVAPLHVDGSDLKLFMMQTAPGQAMLSHGHSAREWTVILQGSYRDEHGHFPEGAFIEETENDHHRPVVDSAQTCVTLFALEGQIVARGLSGMVARWLLR